MTHAVVDLPIVVGGIGPQIAAGHLGDGGGAMRSPLAVTAARMPRMISPYPGPRTMHVLALRVGVVVAVAVVAAVSG